MPQVLLLLANGGVSSSMDTTHTLSERLQIGVEVTLLGLGIVFTILLLLWGCLELFKIVFYDMPNRINAKKINETAINTEINTEPEAIIAYQNNVDTGNDELIAAISAAVAVYCGTDLNSEDFCETKFRVVSFKRVGKQR